MEYENFKKAFCALHESLQIGIYNEFCEKNRYEPIIQNSADVLNEFFNGDLYEFLRSVSSNYSIDDPYAIVKDDFLKSLVFDEIFDDYIEPELERICDDYKEIWEKYIEDDEEDDFDFEDFED